MKILGLNLLLLLSIFTVSAQQLSSQIGKPDLEVMGQKWSVVIDNPLLNEDPFQPINDIKQAQQDEINYRKQSEIRAKMGLPPEPKPTRIKPMDNERYDVSSIYTYEVKIKNNGQKQVDSLIWVYVFLDPETKLEMGRRLFESKVGLSPGKTKSISIRSGLSPTPTIDVRDNKKSRDKFSEQIFIQSIKYRDGSSWEATAK